MHPTPEIGQYEQERRQKLQKLRDLGVDPFGGRTEGLSPLADVKASHKPEMGQDGGPTVKVAGRVLFIRDIGKLQFWRLRDEGGELQVALDKKRLSERDWEVVKLTDLADQVVIEGPLGTTKTGEPTVWAKTIFFAAKALLPPPAKHEGLTDVELRYRQRYVDLWANPEVMRLQKLRIRIVDEVRQFMRSKGYAEVETPMLQPIHGGAAARPFETHHKALDMNLYLRIAPELYLKRLLVGGFQKVFEINRNFRNEGISPRHNPEFTMLEAYEAFGSWETMADLVEEMICHVAQAIFGTLKIEHRNAAGEVTRTINLERPWRRVSMSQLVEDRTGWKFDKRPAQEAFPRVIDLLVAHRVAKMSSKLQALDGRLRSGEDVSDEAFAELAELETNANAPFVLERLRRPIRELTPEEQLVEAYEKLIEPELIDPTFVTHIPSILIPLAKESLQHPGFADVYELAINGVEISPGYSELNDPDVQREQFAHQVGDKEEQQKVDDDFLTALKYGMPPAGGMGMGIDRLVMMLTGAESIRDVILFPLMRPQE